MFGFLKSTVGKKYLMGLSGLIWVGFVLSHMAGNMLLFIGPDAYNSYSHSLTSNRLIYVAEAILVGALLTHIGLAIRLTLENRAARPTGYAVQGNKGKKAQFGSRWMGIQGSLILVFIVTHLAAFKYGTVYMTTVDGVQMRDIHKLVIELFQQPGYVAWYCVAVALLCVHLSHGVTSIFQSFGLLHPTYQPMIRKAGIGYAVIVSAGFISQPIYAFLIAR